MVGIFYRSSLFLETGPLTKPEIHYIGKIARPLSSFDPLVFPYSPSALIL